ncbi:RelA/SpoT domain-containing protein [Francisella tularensis]|uniref:RelA/SpoT domain-containing protein n=1 Tax=Francisella tularensis TaxID=263 RepID=UPI0001855217|nr:RelA/SpoT domain-containing protein [Francisella tularensis]EDZ90390.1 RelA/SpoT domain protein [Francisella tularensis subsp. novicida FTG]MBK2334688.1 RelA/SpoT domain-containing protein [Francisella tularensis subsp. novicida]
MVIEELSLSRNQVKKAGKILKDTNSSLEDRDKAFDILSEWRARHIIPLNLAYKMMKNHVLKHDKKAIFGQRLKRAISIINKLNRFKSGLGEMQDIAGCRAIVSNYKSLLAIDESLSKTKNISNTQGKNYILNPKDDGYRGIHKIYKYIGEKPYCKGLSVEIQLRTKLQHSWATTVEIVDIIENEKLKNGQGSEDWQRFFYLVSNEFAKLDKLPNTDANFYIDEIRKLEKKLGAIDKLKAYKAVSSNLLETISSKKFILLWLKKKERTIQIFNFDSYESAKQMYVAMEKEYTNNNDFDVLLVNVESMNELKKAYPNYFADSSEFVSKLEKILRKKVDE